MLNHTLRITPPASSRLERRGRREPQVLPLGICVDEYNLPVSPLRMSAAATGPAPKVLEEQDRFVISGATSAWSSATDRVDYGGRIGGWTSSRAALTCI